MRKFLFILIFNFLFSQIIFSQVTEQNRQFFSQSLDQNRKVIVFKPDSCTETSQCPVLIFLPGWGMPPTSFPFFKDVLRDLINSGKIEPMLIVVPDGTGGLYTRSFYWNSIVNGNYGDYIVKDLVDWITQEYSVRKGFHDQHHRDYWLLGGFSLGGGGCARLTFKYHDVFSGFAAFSGDIALEHTSDIWFENARSENPDNIFTPPDPNQYWTYPLWGAASAFSPDTTTPYKAQFPLEEGTGVVRDSIFTLWLQSNSVCLANKYFNVLGNSSSSMNIRCSVDEAEIYFAFNQYFCDSLKSWDVNHIFDIHTFGHAFNEELATELLLWADAHFAPAIIHQNDIETLPLLDQFTNINLHTKYKPKVILRNLGSETQSNFQITCEILDDGAQIYSDIQSIDSLKSLEKIQITFAEWAPLKKNNYDLLFHSNLSSDEDKSNDSLTMTLTCTDFLDDFESGFQKWYTKTGWGLTQDETYSSNYSLVSNPYEPYKNNMNYCVQYRQSLNLKNLNAAYLSFWHKFQTEKFKDVAYIAVSTDGGNNWNQIGSSYSGKQLFWIDDIASLTDFCGTGFDDVRIRLHLVTDEHQELPLAGWFLDDIKLNLVIYNHDLTVSSLVEPNCDLPLLVNFYPKAVVRNIGMVNELNVSLKCEIDTSNTNIFSQELIIDHIESISSETFLFEQWTPQNISDYNFRFFTSLETDENKHNDTLKLAVKVTNSIDDFEANLINWTSDINWGIDDYSAHSGGFSLANFPNGNYSNNINAWIAYNHAFNLSQVESAYIKYWTKHYIEINHDFGYVEVSADSGKSWNQLGEAYTGFRTTWEENWRSLKDYCGSGFEHVLLRFRFISDSTQAFPALGWFLDDISIHEGTPPATDVFVSDVNLPGSHDLFNNYPNPFNPRTTIKYQISEATKVRIIIYNLLGQKVKTLIDQKQQPGHFQVAWDGRNESGQTVPSGVYFYKLETEQFSKVNKMLLLK